MMAEAEHDSESALARQTLQIVFAKRRLAGRACDGSSSEASACELCYSVHQQSVAQQIRRGRPLQLVLPAFPAKSPNLSKVLGPLPDMAEQLALDYLQSICDRIAEIYAPGARLTICSDGRVFSDLVGVSDRDVTRYYLKLRAILTLIRAGSIDVMRLEDVFEGDDFDRIRALLVERYGEPLEALRQRIKSNGTELLLFNGIARFLFEDGLYLHQGASRNSIRVRCKALAYQVIQRSHAWSNLVAERYPDALRLSIHPYPPHAKKIGIGLLDAADDNWLTPWHGVALRIGDRFTLTKRRHAEQLRAKLVHDADGYPAYFSMEGS
jgi:L-tyrosine isonitrile synthase